MAAVLACGDGAVLSHQSAGELWWLRRRRNGRPDRRDDSERARVGGRRRGIAIHRASALLRRGAHSSLPDSRDHAPPGQSSTWRAILPRRQLERAIDEAERLKQLHRRRPGRDRASLTSAAPVPVRSAPCSTITASARPPPATSFEERFLALCRRHRLPQPDVNVPLLDYVVDFLWPRRGWSSRSTAARLTGRAVPSRPIATGTAACRSPATASCGSPGSTSRAGPRWSPTASGECSPPPLDRRSHALATYRRYRPSKAPSAGSAHRRLQVLVDGRQELLGRLELLVGADQQREVLGHLAALDRLDADALERLGELGDLGRVVHPAAGVRGRGSRRRSRRSGWSRSRLPSWCCR